ncbi:hypothetical protein MC885_017768, partial [Smutsia gigantea]
DISSMEKMHWHKTSQLQAEQGLQKSFEEPKLNMLEELPGAVSSIFQIEQEDILECGASEAEFKLQETLEVQPADESSKPLEDEQPKKFHKTPLLLPCMICAPLSRPVSYPLTCAWLLECIIQQTKKATILYLEYLEPLSQVIPTQMKSKDIEYCKEFLLLVTVKTMLLSFQQYQGHHPNRHKELCSMLTNHASRYGESKCLFIQD